LLALSIAAFPEELPLEMLGQIFAAADAQVRAAGALLAGGHTIRDEEPKYGLAVVGTVHPDGIWSKAGARPGDALFLTKPLGTGLVLTGVKDGLLDARALERAIALMRTLNRASAAPTKWPTGAGSGSGSKPTGCPPSTEPERPPGLGSAPAATGAIASSRGRTSRSTVPTTLSSRLATTRKPRAASSSLFPRTRA